jgi:hypothetical protein
MTIVVRENQRIASCYISSKKFTGPVVQNERCQVSSGLWQFTAGFPIGAEIPAPGIVRYNRRTTEDEDEHDKGS